MIVNDKFVIHIAGLLGCHCIVWYMLGGPYHNQLWEPDSSMFFLNSGKHVSDYTVTTHKSSV